MRPKTTIFAGNPGGGKSTLLNAVVGKKLFTAGCSDDGGGVTQTFRSEAHNGHFFCDTPGLDDAKRRTEAAKQITNAIKSSHGPTQLIFVLTITSGRLAAGELLTLKLVLDALANQEVPIGTNFGIICNHLSQRDMVHFDGEKGVELVKKLLPRGYQTENIMFVPSVPELHDKENATAPPKIAACVQEFVQSLPVCEVDVKKVQDVQADEWERKYVDMEASVAKLKDELKHAIQLKDATQSKTQSPVDLRFLLSLLLGLLGLFGFVLLVYIVTSRPFSVFFLLVAIAFAVSASQQWLSNVDGSLQRVRSEISSINHRDQAHSSGQARRGRHDNSRGSGDMQGKAGRGSHSRNAETERGSDSDHSDDTHGSYASDGGHSSRRCGRCGSRGFRVEMHDDGWKWLHCATCDDIPGRA